MCVPTFEIIVCSLSLDMDICITDWFTKWKYMQYIHWEANIYIYIFLWNYKVSIATSNISNWHMAICIERLYFLLNNLVEIHLPKLGTLNDSWKIFPMYEIIAYKYASTHGGILKYKRPLVFYSNFSRWLCILGSEDIQQPLGWHFWQYVFLSPQNQSHPLSWRFCNSSLKFTFPQKGDHWWHSS